VDEAFWRLVSQNFFARRVKVAVTLSRACWNSSCGSENLGVYQAEVGVSRCSDLADLLLSELQNPKNKNQVSPCVDRALSLHKPDSLRRSVRAVLNNIELASIDPDSLQDCFGRPKVTSFSMNKYISKLAMPPAGDNSADVANSGICTQLMPSNKLSSFGLRLWRSEALKDHSKTILGVLLGKPGTSSTLYPPLARNLHSCELLAAVHAVCPQE
jgi:hypothetical protein